MKLRMLICLMIGSFMWSVTAQDKERVKELEKRYATFSKHKKFYDKDKWSMVRFHIVYKLTTAKVAKSMDKNDYVKVKSSSGAYGILKGVSEDDLQAITDQVARNFMQRMNEEAGIEIITWGSFEGSPNTKKIKEMAMEREVYSKSQGLGYAVSYDGTPVWNKVIQIIPDGKKIAKELDSNNGMLTIYIDFADAVSEASTSVTRKGDWIYYSESAEQNILPVVRIIPNMQSQNAWEQATNIGFTQFNAQSEQLYTFSMSYMTEDPEYLQSEINYATKVEAFKGDLPEVLANRANNKIEYVSTFEVTTTPEKYGAAVMDVTNKFFDDLIEYYNLVSAK
ncbi:MAG: hypothetical protein RIC30_06720 [Marinoscillum sp.]|uniref:hypothetical protein n=1 Tax=Marinoscillum sp. TaxID=2024838 RepID=UPI003300B81B